MHWNCKRFTLLLFATLATNTDSHRLTPIQNFIRENYVDILTNSLLRTVKASSQNAELHMNSVLDTGPENADLSRASSKGDNNEGYSRNSSRAAHRDSGWWSMLDLLKHVRSVENAPRGNCTGNKTRAVLSSSVLRSRTTALIAGSSGKEVNLNDVRREDSAALNATGASSPSSPLTEADSTEKPTPIPMRSRRGAFLLLPENHAERQGYFSPSETCRQEELVHVLRPPGCLQRVVRTSSCQGTCHSRSVLQWDMDLQQLRHVAYCTCCKPHQLSYRRTSFRCPGRQRKVLVLLVGVATQCACRPCSEGDPELQQPYD